jgi:hypothetical protein
MLAQTDTSDTVAASKPVNCAKCADPKTQQLHKEMVRKCVGTAQFPSAACAC